MRIEKKDVYIIILSLCLIFLIGISLFLGTNLGISQCCPPPPPETLIVGTNSGPNDLDPCDSWDKASNDVIRQVAETLFTYNLSEPDLPKVNLLAESYFWNVNNTILTVSLRQGIKFHDGTDFNADAVKWNLDRFMYLMNHTGGLPSDGRAVKIHSLYEFPDGSPIFDEILVLSNSTIEIYLNAPYAPLLDALSYTSSSMLSPSSTPERVLIDETTGDLIGTGPYMYDYYIADSEVGFTKFENYWREEVMFERMIYRVIDDPTARNYAMFAREIDIILDPMRDLLPAYDLDPLTTTYENFGLDYQYLLFNNKKINVTWRKAMSYAVNYTYIIEEMSDGLAFRSFGPISPGFGEYYDPGIVNNAPYYNLTIARQTLINDPGVNTTGLSANDNHNDTAWESADLATFKYSYYAENGYKADLYPLLEEWFDDIGITVVDDGWSPPLFGPPWGPPWSGNNDYLDLYWLGWGPDHLDPITMFLPLFSNTSESNGAQVNDNKLQKMMENAIREVNDLIRVEIYKNISYYLAEELFPHAFLYHNKVYHIHSADLYDVPYNAFNDFHAYHIKRNLNWIPPF